MISQQFTKFIFVGIASTIINYSTFFLFLNFFLLNFILASAAGYFLGLVFGYFFNRLWTFGVTESHWIQKIKYLITYTFSLIIGLLVLNLLVTNLNIQSEIANIYVIFITTVLNFFGTKIWVFKK